MSTVNLRDDLCRLARFGANITDAFGCFILLPHSIVAAPDASGSGSHANTEILVLAGHHSLSNDVIRGCQIYVGNGLVGWVSKHKRSIHVSPFERDSRTLGFYHTDQQLKSFIGIPIFLEHLDGTSQSSAASIAGVVACDSKKSFAFSKLQGKLLEDLSCEISSTLRLAHMLQRNGGQKISWQRFLSRAHQLSDSLGRDSLEVLRVKVNNQSELESQLGSGTCMSLMDQVLRLVEQALPPHFPCFRTPLGELIMIVDNMMTSFLENKILALCSHCASSSPLRPGSHIPSIDIQFIKRSNRIRKYRRHTIEELIDATGRIDGETDAEVVRTQNFGKASELNYEYKRA
ncbi:MAG: GAF domain-containing protein [Deltaproteobacteria bacterium]|nr:GAF domain-containing protein [Deltaproteobacteria bacterium]